VNEKDWKQNDSPKGIIYIEQNSQNFRTNHERKILSISNTIRENDIKFIGLSVDGVIICDGKITKSEDNRSYHIHKHMKMKCESERISYITNYVPDLLNKRGTDKLTNVIHQQPNEADIITHSAPVIDRNIHKNISMTNRIQQVQISQKRQLYLEYRT